MARLSDVPRVIRRVGFFKFTARVWNEVGEDHLLTWGAALAYSWLFSVFPFLIFLLTLVPYLPDNAIEAAKKQIPESLHYYLASNAADAIWDNIRWVIDKPQGGLLSLGLIVTIWAASGGVNMTMTALDRCYEVEKGRGIVKRRVIAIGLTVIVASLVLLVLLLIPIGNLGTKYALKYWDEKGWSYSIWVVYLWNAARYALALTLMFGVVGIMYRYGVAVKQRFRWFSPGAVFTIGVWLLLSFVFRFYVNQFGKESYSRTYGTVGGVAVLLLFFYLDALVLMLGAEINSEIDYEVLGVPRGSLDFTVTPEEMIVERSMPSAPPVGAPPVLGGGELRRGGTQVGGGRT
ncbi:MAG TPA: YihY/virulence factor BrkB family protein [Tepidisphaeraceae bacterium]|nr:YihY/virulence factor BrkB family protein [Tepidisphaeraceae bacterium]